MPDLKLARLPDRKPVKLTIHILPELKAALTDYTAAYERPTARAKPLATSYLTCSRVSSTATGALRVPAGDNLPAMSRASRIFGLTNPREVQVGEGPGQRPERREVHMTDPQDIGDQQFVTVADFARIVRVSRRTIDRYRRARPAGFPTEYDLGLGTVPRPRFKLGDVLQWLDSRALW